MPHFGHGLPFGHVSGGFALGLQLMAGAGPGGGGGVGDGDGAGPGAPPQQLAASASAPLLEQPTANSCCGAQVAQQLSEGRGARARAGARAARMLSARWLY